MMDFDKAGEDMTQIYAQKKSFLALSCNAPPSNGISYTRRYVPKKKAFLWELMQIHEDAGITQLSERQ